MYLPPWRIDHVTRSGVRLPVSIRSVARVAATALTRAGAPRPASLAVVFSDDRELHELNLEHMAEDHPTDVLSFPLLQPSAFPAHTGGDRRSDGPIEPEYERPGRQRTHLGDIVVSVERAITQAPEQGWSPRDEMLQLVAHGVLHVCGWDHADEAEGNAMRALEREILGSTR